MKKRILAVLLVAAMVLALAGCSCTECSTSVNSDGSGVLSLQYGLTQKGLEAIASAAGSGLKWTDVLQDSQSVPFTKNGVTYYGVSERHAFGNLNEFTQIMNGIGASSDVGVALNAGGISLTQTNGSFLLVVDGVYDKDGVTETLNQSNIKVTGELEKLVSEMVMELTFTFPTAVTQTGGSAAGVTISNNTVTLDATKLAGKYSFTTSTDGPFSDVAVNAWYCQAITALSQGGLVNGVGNNLFKPTNTITYSEFCQVLAKAKGMTVGAENGYWAAKAIKSCLDGGYLANRGDITPANYDVAITRETAVSGLVKAIPQALLVEVNAAPTVPDINTVAAEFQNDVLNAYRYGVAKGTGNGTFNPKGTLSRAEFCQLLYNVGWTTPA